MNKPSITRRNFLNKSGVCCAALPMVTIIPQSVKGANDRLEIGVIGCGNRGRKALMKDIHKYDEKNNVAITAVCDVWRQHREQAVLMTLEWYGKAARQFEDYREMLPLENIDAVVIACPDHLHCTILEEAAKAGKDAYCEKPLAMNMKELNRTVDAVKKNKRIVQVGTQLRSYDSFTGCRQVVKDGLLGRFLKASQVRNTYRPYWHSHAVPVKESDTNWPLFLGRKKKRPFNEDQFAVWYGYRDFSSGPIGGYMSHFIDLVHYMTGAKFPHSAVTQGGIYAWIDQRTCPDSVHTLLEYPEGFMVSYSTMFGNANGSYMKFFGTRGMIDSTDWSNPFMTGQGSEDPNRIPAKKAVTPLRVPHHMDNWLQCLRTRTQPNANIDAGYQHAVACILADEAMVKERKMIFHPESRKIRPA